MTAQYPTIHGRFEAISRRHPRRTAVVGSRLSLTYGQLSRLSDAFAWQLTDAGVRLRAPVVICLDRSPEAIIAMLAVLKAGGTYVPMDPSYPPAVRQSYVNQLGARIVVVGDGFDENPDIAGPDIIRIAGDDVEVSALVPVSDLLLVPAGEDDPAYIMFTSGSTGSPKGVLVPHRGVLRLVSDTNYIELGADDTLLQLSPITFDASTFEIWGALLNGGRLVLYEETVFDINALNALVKREKVTVMADRRALPSRRTPLSLSSKGCMCCSREATCFMQRRSEPPCNSIRSSSSSMDTVRPRTPHSPAVTS